MLIPATTRMLAATALGCALWAVGPAARADVYFSAGVPVYTRPAYVQPPPVYVDPQAAVVAPYGSADAAPYDSWEQRQEWRRRYWEHRRWEHRRWEHRMWERRHHRDWDDNDD